MQTFNERCYLDYINIWHFFESANDLINSRKLLDRYLELHLKTYKRKPAYFRPHIARSDPALNSGIVPAVVAGKIALSEFYRFGKDNDIKIFPGIGVGTLPFRGSLSPERISDFLREYPGIRTAYIQSAFRYDFPLPIVKKAIKRLNKELSKTNPILYNKKRLRRPPKYAKFLLLLIEKQSGQSPTLSINFQSKCQAEEKENCISDFLAIQEA